MRRLTVVSNSEVKTFRTCVRKWYYSHIILRRPIEKSAALRFGTLFHSGLEAYWKTANVQAFLAVFDDHPDRYEAAKARALAIGYVMRWADASPFTVTGVEQQFCTPVNVDDEAAWVNIAGKVDAVGVYASGVRFIAEHKTSSEDIQPGSVYWRRLRMDSQISTYTNALGTDLALYDVIGKLKLEPKLATPIEDREYCKTGKRKGLLHAHQHAEDETPEEFFERCCKTIAADPAKYYQRGEVTRGSAEASAAEADIRDYVVMMQGAIASGRFPRNPDACMGYGRPCEYLGVCTHAETIDNDSVFYTSNNPHEELTNGQQ